MYTFAVIRLKWNIRYPSLVKSINVKHDIFIPLCNEITCSQLSRFYFEIKTISIVSRIDYCLKISKLCIIFLVQNGYTLTWLTSQKVLWFYKYRSVVSRNSFIKSLKDGVYSWWQINVWICTKTISYVIVSSM